MAETWVPAFYRTSPWAEGPQDDDRARLTTDLGKAGIVAGTPPGSRKAGDAHLDAGARTVEAAPADIGKAGRRDPKA